jgi:hypothetical protein
MTRREKRTPAQQAEHETYASLAKDFGGDRSCDKCGEWTTINRRPVSCDCEKK